TRHPSLSADRPGHEGNGPNYTLDRRQCREAVSAFTAGESDHAALERPRMGGTPEGPEGVDLPAFEGGFRGRSSGSTRGVAGFARAVAVSCRNRFGSSPSP